MDTQKFEKLEQFVRGLAFETVETDKSIVELCNKLTVQVLALQSCVEDLQERVKRLQGISDLINGDETSVN